VFGVWCFGVRSFVLFRVSDSEFRILEESKRRRKVWGREVPRRTAGVAFDSFRIQGLGVRVNGSWFEV